MFTGLIEDLGTVAAVERVPQGVRVSVRTRLDGLTRGASIAVDGACLTAVEVGAGRFTADVSAETLTKTTLGERKAGDRVGGHLVLGHVDGVGEIVGRTPVGDGMRVEVRIPPELAPLIVSKGSIALDGISLTVNELLDPERIALFLIPETLRATTWGSKTTGARVNVEADILGKHVARLMQFRT
jgi:riboflavin synthase